MQTSTRKRRKAGNHTTDVDPRAILARHEQEQLVVVEGGKRKNMSAVEAMERKLWAIAMTGNPRAIRQIIRRANDYLELPQNSGIRIRVVPNDYYQ